MVKKPAVFLDRDGVIIEDVDLLTHIEQVNIYQYTPESIRILHNAGFVIAVVTNQPVVARGRITEREVIEINKYINSQLRDAVGVGIDEFYFCPHHPNATLPEYRIECGCRKPRPGMLQKAADELGLDLCKSYMIGDRISDIIAGQAAGVSSTIQLCTGKHNEPPIQSKAMDLSVKPDYLCKDLKEAVEIVINDLALNN